MSPASPRPLVHERQAVNLSLLLRLRWLAAAGQASLALATSMTAKPDVPPLWLLGIAAIVALSNASLIAISRTRPLAGAATHALVVLFDTVLLTSLLHATGGAMNPFSSLYLLQVVLAALLSTPAWTGVVLIGCIVGYATLFTGDGAHHLHHLDGHLFGMWATFVILGPFLAWAITRLRRDLAEADAREASSLAARERDERLASLATLATGAAHELSTPLGTISVAVHEMHAVLLESQAEPQLLEDAQLIAEQVNRCAEILGQMAADAGSARGETPVPTSALELCELIVSRLKPSQLERVEVNYSSEEPALIPRRLVARAVRGLVKNALEASPSSSPILLSLSGSPDHLHIEVADRGEPLSDEQLTRLGEPFFTTKPAGDGIGLGVFFCRSVAEFLGGRLDMERREGGGLTASMHVPLGGVR